MSRFVVPALPKVIPQDKANAGWFAAACMLAHWRQRRGILAHNDNNMTEAHRHRADTSLPLDDMRRLAGAFGLSQVPPVHPVPSPMMLEQWLRRYGPLWTDAVRVDGNGLLTDRGHVVVIGGVDTTPAAPRIYVLDPWPNERGHEGWRPYNQLHSLLVARDEKPRKICFLSHP